MAADRLCCPVLPTAALSQQKPGPQRQTQGPAEPHRSIGASPLRNNRPRQIRRSRGAGPAAAVRPGAQSVAICRRLSRSGCRLTRRHRYRHRPPVDTARRGRWSSNVCDQEGGGVVMRRKFVWAEGFLGNRAPEDSLGLIDMPSGLTLIRTTLDVRRSGGEPGSRSRRINKQTQNTGPVSARVLISEPTDKAQSDRGTADSTCRVCARGIGVDFRSLPADGVDSFKHGNKKGKHGDRPRLEERDRAQQ